MPLQSVKKVAERHFFEFYGFASRISSRAAKPAKYENLRVFIRSDAHVVRAGLNIRGCGPLSTPRFFDSLERFLPLFCFLEVFIYFDYLQSCSSDKTWRKIKVNSH